MTALAPKTTHVAEGIRKLLSVLRETTNEGFVEALLKRVQEIEDAAHEVISKRSFDGEGAQLDALGRLVLRGRVSEGGSSALDDEDFKVALSAQVRINRSWGTPPDIQEVVALSLPEGFHHTYDEYYPKAVMIRVTETVDFDVVVLWTNARASKGQGTRLLLEYTTLPVEESFLLSDEDEDDVDAETLGFADEDEDEAIGGALSDVLG